MRYWPASDPWLERYEVADGTGVHWRPDGWRCRHTGDMTVAERTVADVFARKVGWMP